MLRLLSYAILLASLTACVQAAPPRKLPQAPEVLIPLNARLSGRLENKTVQLSLTANEPITESQWTAIEGLPIQRLNLKGPGINDVAMARLKNVRVESLVLEHAAITEGGAAHLKEMTYLKNLSLIHTKLPPSAASTLAFHPSLESFSDDEKLGAEGMDQIATIPNLKRVRLAHGAANDNSVSALAKHPAIESLFLWPSGTYGLTNAALPALGSIPRLNDLTITDSVLDFDGGLSHLIQAKSLTKLTLRDVAITEEDLAKLKAALPDLAIEHTPMSEELRKKWDLAAEKRKRARP
ncbi:leucine-rich repeat domain-containing protein [Lignipirellula cremea]|uniref:Leucine Rich repeats (2 copies) n=1 Tax=Lignipirellula cremea TaxID=2528010 RepID=A0A518DKN1_9BACT|nr:hypothetical protein [Lignipirellula cremea]QDU92393.1 hypothetical protein Pla8534_01400 [Lignipirellula cremea]